MVHAMDGGCGMLLSMCWRGDRCESPVLLRGRLNDAIRILAPTYQIKSTDFTVFSSQ